MTKGTKKSVLAIIFSILALGASAQTVSSYPRIAELQVPSLRELGFESATNGSDNVPLLLEGIWQNEQRCVVFDSHWLSTYFEDGELARIILKTFYGWYYDRAAEANSFSQEMPRERNDVHSSSPEEIQVSFVPLTYQVFPQSSGIATTLRSGDQIYSISEVSGAWDLEIKYPARNEIYHVPVAVLGNRLYLNFLVKELETIPMESQDYHLLGGFWRDFGKANGILVSPPYNKKELLSYFVAGNSVYQIRYWETDMDYEAKDVVFADGQNTYHVPKHLAAQGTVYTCVNGRGSKIRNITRSGTFNEKFLMNELLVVRHGVEQDGNAITWNEKGDTILALGEPYLVLEDSSRTMEDLIAENRARKRPEPKPLFPPHGILDFDWSIIEDPPKNWNKRMHSLGK